ncbi:MAG: hypothetical protein CL916_14010 [Deltaproteobacteria bacterium]|nr:hypothetical protein [Deltaproteobacteria bacterium]
MSEEQPDRSWKWYAKKIVRIMGGGFVFLFLLIAIRITLGAPDTDALRANFAKTKMSKSAQKQALQVVDCISSNPVYWGAIAPVIGRFRIPVPGWMVLRFRRRLAVVDYSRSSKSTRMWIFDTSSGALLKSAPVRHGDGKGTQKKSYVTAFSNKPGSQLSSLGVLMGTFPAIGGLKKKWPSKKILLLEGQEKGWNNNIRTREIIIHSTKYQYSDGCLSTPIENLSSFISNLMLGGFIYAHYPSAKYKKSSKFLNCGAQ